MISKTFSAAAVALAASTLVSAQTFTDCNPLKTSCKPDSAFGSPKVEVDFTKGLGKAFHSLSGTDLKSNGQGAVFTINKESDAPTIATDKYIFFGRLDIEVQAAAGQGIVTSAVLQSDDLDEIDLEWVGADNAQVQSNYFSKGDTSTYDRGAYHPVSNPTGEVHTYSIDWTPTAVKWIVDGKTVRTLEAANAHGSDGFPQTPMQVKLGTWVAGGKNSPKGTVEWAGGYTDFSKAPFNAYYKSIAITDYAGGNGPTDKSVKEYVYGDKSGDAKSIKVVDGSGSTKPSDDGDDDSSSSESATQTSTKSSASSTKTEASSATSPTTMAVVTSSDSQSATDAPTSTDNSATTPTSGSPSNTSTGAAAHNVAAAGSFGLAALVAAAFL